MEGSLRELTWSQWQDGNVSWYAMKPRLGERSMLRSQEFSKNLRLKTTKEAPVQTVKPGFGTQEHQKIEELRITGLVGKPRVAGKYLS